ncbi:MAG: hypothetical protein ACHQF4_03330 [Sphingobacteriales bacterium]
MKKAIIILLILFAFGKCFAQGTGYSLPLPEKWKSETIPFPIDFAPTIPYQGIEEIRFTPGWGDVNSNDYWAYTFLWFIDGSPQVNAGLLNTYLTTYFNGLYHSNNKSSPDNTVFTKTNISITTTTAGDQETYSGKISTLNFLTKKKIEFYVTAHVQRYADPNETAIFFEISPKPYSNAVWGQLDNIVNGFQIQK